MPTDDELRHALAGAMTGFAATVRAVADVDLDQRSMCDGWSIRDVIEHVIGGDRFAALVLDGGSLADAIQAVVGVDHLGDDIHRSIADAASGARLGFAESLDRSVDHPIGTISARRFISFRVLDQLGHTWDIGHALGHTVVLDPDSVAVGLQIVEIEREMLDASEHFALPSVVEEISDPQVRFLRAIGRG